MKKFKFKDGSIVTASCVEEAKKLYKVIAGKVSLKEMVTLVSDSKQSLTAFVEIVKQTVKEAKRLTDNNDEKFGTYVKTIDNGFECNVYVQRDDELFFKVKVEYTNKYGLGTIDCYATAYSDYKNMMRSDEQEVHLIGATTDSSDAIKKIKDSLVKFMDVKNNFKMAASTSFKLTAVFPRKKKMSMNYFVDRLKKIGFHVSSCIDGCYGLDYGISSNISLYFKNNYESADVSIRTGEDDYEYVKNISGEKVVKWCEKNRNLLNDYEMFGETDVANKIKDSLTKLK